MTTAELIKARTSIRAYLPTPLSQTEVHALLDAARWAPSGGNLQPWKVIVVAGAARESVIAAAAKTLAVTPRGETIEHPIYPNPVPEPYQTRRLKVAEDMYALLNIPRDDKATRIAWVRRNFQFFGAPVGVFFIIDKAMGHGQWAHLGMFIQSFALVAQERGLSTCMQEAWATVRPTLHAHFKLAAEEMVYCGLALGHADPAAPVNTLRSDREPVSTFARFEGFA
jgi:nitroreductase